MSVRPPAHGRGAREMFPVLLAIPRTSGWPAQWQEMRDDPEQKIARPRQLSLGAGERPYVEKLEPRARAPAPRCSVRPGPSASES